MESLSQRPNHHKYLKALPKEYRDIAESAINHFGNLIDNTNIHDLIEAAPYIAAFHFGFQSDIRTDLKIEERIKSGAIAMIGLKLAVSGGGTPPVSQIAGLAILASIGLVGLTSKLTQDYQKALDAKRSEIQSDESLTDEQKKEKQDAIDKADEYLKQGRSYDALNAWKNI